MWLLQQKSIYSQKEAVRLFYAHFPLTSKRKHVPADLSMEWIVGDSKEFARNLFSNKNPHILEKHSPAIPVVRRIACKFDEQAQVTDGHHGRGNRSRNDDESILSEILGKLEPFKNLKRSNAPYEHIPSSIIERLDTYAFSDWFDAWKDRFCRLST